MPGGAALAEPHALYSDEEVFVELEFAMATGNFPTAQEIAAQYIYPLKYVEEVLLAGFAQRQEERKHEFATIQDA